jgi:hypothetical protein
MSQDIDKWVAQMPRAEIEAEIARLRSRLATLERLLAISPSGAVPSKAGRGAAVPGPRLDEAILQIVGEDVGREWPISEIRQAVAERGIGDRGEKAVAATLSRLARSGRLLRTGRGVYRSPHVEAGDP